MSIFTEISNFVRTKENLSTIVDHLNKWGCCCRCILRFVGVKEADVFRMNDITSLWAWVSTVAAAANPDDGCKKNVVDSSKTIDVMGELESGHSANFVNDSCKMKIELRKKNSEMNTSLCTTCLGILQERFCCSAFVDEIARAVCEQQFEHDSFLCSVSVPVCMMLREYGTLLALCHLFPSIFAHIHQDSITPVKDVWKWVNGPRLASALKFPFDQKSPFEIIISFTYTQNDSECGFLYRLQPSIFRRRKKNQKQLQNADVFNRANVSRAINESSLEAYRCAYKCPPTRPSSEVDVSPIVCQHAALYIAGRYNKFSRELSQTPWLIDGERKSESSVEEHICQPINKFVLASEWRFSASGREDVDVRMLGTGRPFVVEFINPRRVNFTREQMKTAQLGHQPHLAWVVTPDCGETNVLQTFRLFKGCMAILLPYQHRQRIDGEELINSGTSNIAVRDLQVVPKDETSILKQGEEDKQKSYVAVCWSHDEITDEQITELETVRDLTLQQKTPIRVLHRRPLATRERTIYSLSAKLINAEDRHNFLLFLKTQAGTYIKEFVHGDFGRTIPSLGNLLKTECDILQLDVLAVELSWPPSLSDSDAVLVAAAETTDVASDCCKSNC